MALDRIPGPVASRIILPTTGTTNDVLTWNGLKWVSGTPSAGSLVTLATLTPTAVASVSDTTHLTSTYKYYEVELINVIPATNNDTLILQITEGGTVKSDAAYASQMNAFRTNATGLVGGVVANTTGTYIQLTRTSFVSNVAADNGVSCTIKFMDPANATGKKFIRGDSAYMSTAATSMEYGLFSGYYSTNNTAIDGFQLSFLGGNITSGRIVIKGGA